MAGHDDLRDALRAAATPPGEVREALDAARPARGELREALDLGAADRRIVVDSRSFGELSSVELEAMRDRLVGLGWLAADAPLPSDWRCYGCGRQGLMLEQLEFIDRGGSVTPVCPYDTEAGHRSPRKHGWVTSGTTEADGWSTVRPSEWDLLRRAATDDW